MIKGLIASHTQSSEHGLHRAKIPTSVQMYLDFCIVVSYPDEPSFMRAVCLFGSEIEAGEWTVLLELSRWRNSDTVRLAIVYTSLHAGMLVSDEDVFMAVQCSD